DDVNAWISYLVQGELIEKQSEEYTFRHALLREAAYAMLTDADRVRGHLAAAEYLEQAGERDPGVLARHFDLGGDRSRAVACYVLAAERALSNDVAGCLALVKRGLALDPNNGALLTAGAEASFWSADMQAAHESAKAARLDLPRGSSRWCRATDMLAAT